MSTLHKLIRQERIRRRWSQKYLAKKMGTTRVTISRWEHGATVPSTFFWPHLSKFLGKPIEELFPEPTQEPSADGVAPSFPLGGIDDQLPLPSAEQYQLDLEKQRLELKEKHMEVQQKRLLYIRDQLEMMLDLLEPQIDPIVRTMVFEAAFSHLEHLPLDYV